MNLVLNQSSALELWKAEVGEFIVRQFELCCSPVWAALTPLFHPQLLLPFHGQIWTWNTPTFLVLKPLSAQVFVSSVLPKLQKNKSKKNPKKTKNQNQPNKRTKKSWFSPWNFVFLLCGLNCSLCRVVMTAIKNALIGVTGNQCGTDWRFGGVNFLLIWHCDNCTTGIFLVLQPVHPQTFPIHQ